MAIRGFTRPQKEFKPDEEDEAIPWPKIEGSLPIQMPDSVSPRIFGRQRSKSVIQTITVDTGAEAVSYFSQIISLEISKADDSKSSGE